nr:MAG TPA: Vpu protein [Caudoviricetes sp.]
MYKKRGCTVFAAFVAVYVAAIIAIVVSEICG